MCVSPALSVNVPVKLTGRGRFFEERAGGVGVEQSFHAMAQVSITATGLVEASGALFRRQSQGGSKNGLFAVRRFHDLR